MRSMRAAGAVATALALALAMVAPATRALGTAGNASSKSGGGSGAANATKTSTTRGDNYTAASVRTVHGTDFDFEKAPGNASAPTTAAALAPPAVSRPINVSLPIIVVGMPKSGTTSLHRYFKCNGLTSAFSNVGNLTWLEDIRTGDDEGLAELVFSVYGEINGRGRLGLATQACARAGRPLFQCIPPHEAYVGFDIPSPPDCFLPQDSHLERMMLDYPTATFVLPRRPASHWLESAEHWRGGMLTRLRMCTQGSFATGSASSAALSPPGGARAAWRLARGELQGVMADFVEAHAARVRELTTRYGRALIEVDIEAEDAGEVLATTVGGAAGCWGKYGAFQDQVEQRQLARAARKNGNKGDTSSSAPVGCVQLDDDGDE